MMCSASETVGEDLCSAFRVLLPPGVHLDPEIAFTNARTIPLASFVSSPDDDMVSTKAIGKNKKE